MTTKKVYKLSTAIATVLPFFVFVMAFAGLLSQHYLPLWAWIGTTITEAVVIIVILYTEEEPPVAAPYVPRYHIGQ